MLQERHGATAMRVSAANGRTDNAGMSGILDPVISRFATVVELEPTIEDWTA
ncbi:hypothetical protein BX592_105271 [Paraburkholderia rhizosphaerae]|uniref:Uncharacterized protein n=1 Tax=Paraburkholderia rhizosphaerae TaxID=480658 RepID=A0A4V3HFC6_9BURK|nr:hypothetical protein BX592_105271 [Paraburkholderia rhizosphaerae]